MIDLISFIKLVSINNDIYGYIIINNNNINSKFTEDYIIHNSENINFKENKKAEMI